MRSMKLHKHHFISAKKKEKEEQETGKRVGMKVHRYNLLCTLLNDFALTMASHEGRK